MTQFKKNISTFSLMMTGVTAIIGSGWLLATQKIANMAGPAGILSWVLGACVALVVGLLFVEIGSAYPSAGGIGYYSNITHGRFCGFLTSWVNWLAIVTVAPIEAQGVTQYLSQLSPFFNTFYDVPSHSLTHLGVGFALFLLVLFTMINYWSVRFFIRFNNFFTIIKIVVPLLTVAALFYSGFHAHNFVAKSDGGFMPFGIKSIFISIVSCGVVMSFNGFQSPLTFSEEIASPKKMLPIAVGGSILIALVLYALLQVAFIGNVSPTLLAHGWAGVNLRSPYVQLLLAANLQIMVMIVYIGSVVSPSVCGAAFVASSSRIMYSLSREKHLPKFLSDIHPVYGNPRNAIVACMLIGAIFLFVFRGWYQLVAVLSVIHLFSYLPAPIVVMANRIKNKAVLTAKDQFMMPAANFLSPFFLFILSILLFYAGWPLIPKILTLIIPGIFIYLFYERKNKENAQSIGAALKGASWLIYYFAGICAIVYFGDDTGGSPGIILSIKESVICLAFLSLTTYYYGVYFAWDRKTHVSQQILDLAR